MPTITIRFSRAAAPTLREMWQQRSPKDYSMCICRLTHSPYSHVDLMIGENKALGASNNPFAPVIEGNPTGVAIRPWPYQRQAIMRDAVIDAPDDKTWGIFVDFCVLQVGKPFDKGALKLGTFLSPRFNRDWRDSSSWYCAELIARAAETSGLVAPILSVKNRITAADLLLVLAPIIVNRWDFEHALC